MQNLIDIARDIPGFHIYDLENSPRTEYVSDDLCKMTGYDRSELTNPNTDAYEALLHPEDRDSYRAFLRMLSSKETRQTIQYRIMRKDGSVIHVQDSMTSRRDTDGRMRGISTLADVTAIKMENEALHSLNETVPCGILKYTCADEPQVTYVNEQMLRILRFPADAPGARSQLDQYKKNIYLMIPPEERERFRRFLNLVASQDKPVAGETTAMRFDGTRVRLYGWISRYDDGFQSVCMDVTDRYDRKRRSEEQQYLRALAQVYDEIFEFDTSRHTVRYVHGYYARQMGEMSGMPMLMEDATRHWLDRYVLEDDREKVRNALSTHLLGEEMAQETPPQVEFRVEISGRPMRSYMGVFLRMSGSGRLFCCRNITYQREADKLKVENSTLRNINEQMQELVMRFTDGMLAFEIREDCVRPLYITDNICQFFGYSNDEWLEMMRRLTPIRDFVAKCPISYEDFLELLESGEGEFHFTDVSTRQIKRIKAIRTIYADEGGERSYVMLCDVTGKDATILPQDTQEKPFPEVKIRTFGYFDVFVSGNPIAFRNEKAKELFALLVDRRGGFVASTEAISLLWEDEPANPVTLARYRKVALRLKNTLEEYGIADVVESVDGKRRIVTQLVNCDLYDYLSGDPQHAQLFKGSYLQNYSWSEMTLAELSSGKFE